MSNQVVDIPFELASLEWMSAVDLEHLVGLSILARRTHVPGEAPQGLPSPFARLATIPWYPYAARAKVLVEAGL